MIRSHPLFLNTPIYDVFIKLYYYTPPLAIIVALVSLARRRGALDAPLGDPGRRAYLAELAVALVGAGLLLLGTFAAGVNTVRILRHAVKGPPEPA